MEEMRPFQEVVPQVQLFLEEASSADEVRQVEADLQELAAEVCRSARDTNWYLKPWQISQHHAKWKKYDQERNKIVAVGIIYFRTDGKQNLMATTLAAREVI